MRLILSLLLVTVVSSSCKDISTLVKKAPNPDYCNIFNTRTSFYFECFSKETNEFYEVSGDKAGAYFATRISDVLEMITWIRQVEFILENADRSLVRNSEYEYLLTELKKRKQLLQSRVFRLLKRKDS